MRPPRDSMDQPEGVGKGFASVIPGCATWRRPGIHTPCRGYGFRVRSPCSRPPNSPLGKCLKKSGARCDPTTRRWIGGNDPAFTSCIAAAGLTKTTTDTKGRTVTFKLTGRYSDCIRDGVLSGFSQAILRRSAGAAVKQSPPELAASFMASPTKRRRAGLPLPATILALRLRRSKKRPQLEVS